MIRRIHPVGLFVFLITVAPCVLVSLRSQIVEKFGSRTGAQLALPIQQLGTICVEKYCQREYQFITPKAAPGSGSWIGFHNTFLSGTVIFGKQVAPEKIVELLKKPPNWHQFHSYEVPSDEVVSILAVAPSGRKKVGMDSEKVFFGTEDTLSAIQTVHSLFSVHIYLALAALTLILTAALRARPRKGRQSSPYVHVALTGILISIVCFFYSHVFDLLFFHLGFSLGRIENSAKWFWGPAVFFLVYKSTRVAVLLSAAYLLSIALTGGMSAETPSLFYASYPLMVAVLTSLSVGAALLGIVKYKNVFPIFPACFMTHDALAINGIIPLLSSSYLSPLCMVGWFAWNHLEGLQTLLNLAVFGQRHENLIRKVAEVRAYQKPADSTGARRKLQDLAFALSQSTKSNRVSILLIDHGVPIIARYCNGRTMLLQDGLTPPVFARVLQTREEMFLVGDDELTSIKAKANQQTSGEKYIRKYAIISPILDGDRIIGAIALTDFLEEAALLSDVYHQEHIRDMISLVKIELANMSARDTHEHQSVLASMQEGIAARFVEETYLATDTAKVIEEFGKAVKEIAGLKTIYFNYDAESDSATYLSSFGLEEVAVSLWQQEVFYSKKDNKLSPIAVAVNEQKSIYIEDIRTFYGFLKEKSIAALSASNSKGFAVLPVRRFGKTHGVLFAIQDAASDSQFEMNDYRFLDKCGEVLALQLYQAGINAKSARNESALRKIIEPDLIETVLLRRELGEQVVGMVQKNFLFLLDLRGSTQASRKFSDPTELAQRLSRIYDESDTLVRSFGGYFEKGSGDGLLFTLRDEPISARNVVGLLTQLASVLGMVAHRELGIEEIIMIAHYGKIFRGIMGSATRMAWDNCGVDLINCFDIEKSAKKCPGIVFAASESFAKEAGKSIYKLISELATDRFCIADGQECVFLFDKTSTGTLFVALKSLDVKSFSKYRANAA